VSGPVIIEERRGDIALISIDHPPVNALAHPVRSALLEAVIAADGDPKVRAIVIRGVGRHFVAGADIREFDQDPRAPLLNDVLKRIEASSKPVIAAMHSAALGGGLELALACHYRIASPDASFGLPEIRLGLLPGSGGTQRLPRLIGATPALALMLSGDPIKCARAAELGIIDRLAEHSGVEAAALAYAEEIAASGAAPRRLCERTVEGGAPDEATIARERSAAQRKFPGVKSVDAIVESVQAAASQPFDAGLALSRRRLLGVERHAIGDEEIRERCLYALINEGAKLLAEGIAASPADIDAIWCNGYGFPRFRGGPMFYADTVGCAAVLEGIGRLAETHGREYWTPAPLLEEIAAAGETFQAWQNRRAASTGAS
jgi:enoyl-CoA hydratase/carnithine racemase